MPTTPIRHDARRLAPRVLLIGDSAHREFANAVAVLRRETQLQIVSDIATAERQLRNGNVPPQLIVIARPHPGSVLPSVIDQLPQQARDCRRLWLLGSWCEGEARVGNTWDGRERVYWHAFDGWWSRYRDLAIGGNREPNKGGLAVVNTANRDMFDAIADELLAAGWSGVWQRRRQPPPLVVGAAVAIWDGGTLADRESHCLADFGRGFVRIGVPLIVLLDFPQLADLAIARQLGASAVVGKPWRHADLIGVCESLSSASRDSRSTRLTDAA